MVMNILSISIHRERERVTPPCPERNCAKAIRPISFVGVRWTVGNRGRNPKKLG